MVLDGCAVGGVAGLKSAGKAFQLDLKRCSVRGTKQAEQGGSVRSVVMTPAAGRCVSSCPHGQYHAPNGQCRQCDLACARCFGPTDKHCRDPTPGSPFGDADCGPGATRRGKRCMLGCTIGYNGVPKYAETRPYAGYYKLSGGQCAPCANYDCLTCSASEPARCHRCKPAPWIRPALKADGRCYESCDSGEFLSSSGACTACDATCASCDGSDAGSCLSCDADGATPILHRGRCLAACPAGFAQAAGGGCVSS